MPKQSKRRLVKDAEFRLRPGQTLIVSVAMLGSGLDRILVMRDRRGTVTVRATNGPGGGRFEFRDVKDREGQCDFWVARTDPRTSIADILRSLFWSQFTWTELDAIRNDNQLRGRLVQATRKLAEEFESTAARRLNTMVKLGQLRRKR